MSRRPQAMLLWIGDIERDTGHLSNEELGAYMRLMWHYYSNGSLPIETKRLASIARTDGASFGASLEPALGPLFGPNWTHKRIDRELQKMAEISAKRYAASLKALEARGKKLSPNGARLLEQMTTKSTSIRQPNHTNIKKDRSTSLVTGRLEPLGGLSEGLLTKVGLRGGGK